MISIVLPCLDERENLVKLLPEITDSVRALGDYEVLVVDGASTDGTRGLVEDYSRTDPKTRYLKQSGSGFGNALLDGIRDCMGDYIVTLDAENHDPSAITQLMEAIDDGYDVVICSRFVKGSRVDLKGSRMLLTRLANMLSRILMRLPVKDTSSGYRMYRGKLLRAAVKDDPITKYFSIQVELLGRINIGGGKICELPVHYRRRIKGKSKFNLAYAVKDSLNLVKIALDREFGSLL
ncbi:glycosyltransferase [Candidatus Altiarchaeota archaeon]